MFGECPESPWKDYRGKVRTFAQRYVFVLRAAYHSLVANLLALSALDLTCCFVDCTTLNAICHSFSVYYFVCISTCQSVYHSFSMSFFLYFCLSLSMSHLSPVSLPLLPSLFLSLFLSPDNINTSLYITTHTVHCALYTIFRMLLISLLRRNQNLYSYPHLRPHLGGTVRSLFLSLLPLLL
jgi:hypothetical protein